VQILGYEDYWYHELESPISDYEDITKEHPEARAAIDNVHKVLQNIVSWMYPSPYRRR